MIIPATIMITPIPMIHLPVSLFMIIKNQEPISKKQINQKSKTFPNSHFILLFVFFNLFGAWFLKFVFLKRITNTNIINNALFPQFHIIQLQLTHHPRILLPWFAQRESNIQPYNKKCNIKANTNTGINC